MKRSMLVMAILGLLSLGSLAMAGDTSSAQDGCPLGCCTSCEGCCGASCAMAP